VPPPARTHHRPLRSRFGIVIAWIFMSRTISSSCIAPPKSSPSNGRRRRGRNRPPLPRTPRVANRLLRRARDFAEVRAAGRITRAVAQESLAMLGIDENGLDESTAT